MHIKMALISSVSVASMNSKFEQKYNPFHLNSYDTDL